MEEIYAYIIRIMLGIFALMSILWWAVHYMIKYKMYKARQEMKETAAEVVLKLEELESRLWDLGIEVTENTYALRQLEKEQLKKGGENAHKDVV